MNQPHPMEAVIPSETMRDEIMVMRSHFTEVYDAIVRTVPEGRYRALALTHLETTAMFAIKAITHTPR